MDELWVLLVFLLLLVPLGALAGTVAFFRLRRLTRELAAAEQRIARLEAGTQAAPGAEHARPATAPEPEPAPEPETSPGPQVASTTPDPWGVVGASASADTSTAPQLPTPPAPSRPSPPLAQQLRQHWMIWLGGGCVGLAGIFMVRYSIEQGLLGPGARILLALVCGLLLHGAAEWLRRRRGQSDVFAALAGGASITLYAALLATLHLLPAVPPGLIFAGMAAVCFATMALALVQGPLLAALGMLGGYLVPMLVSTGSQQIEATLIYALILTASALLLLRYVWRLWLWLGLVGGALLWWALTFIIPPNNDSARTLYLFALSWALLAIPIGDWLLAQRHTTAAASWWALLRENEDEEAQRLLPALLIICLAQGINLWHSAIGIHAIWSLLLLPLLLLYAAGRRPALAPVPGVLVLVLAASLLGRHLDYSQLHLHLRAPAPEQREWLITLLALLPLLYSGYAVLHLRANRAFAGFWAVLACFTPLLMLGLGYLLFTEFNTDWRWALSSFCLGLGFLALGLGQLKTNNQANRLLGVVLLLAAHAAWALAAVMWLREATLTLALALQLLPLAATHRYQPLPLLPWLIRLAILGVIVRLTLNPWLINYPSDLHWSLWTYGGSTLCCYGASYLSHRGSPLQRWLQGAGATLLMLTFSVELRYWLYDGQIFGHRYEFAEAIINTLVWGSAGLIYQWRAGLSKHTATLYRALAAITLTLAAANHLLIVVLLQNPLWGHTLIAPTPLWNQLLPAYGLPTLLLLAVAYLYPPARRPSRLGTSCRVGAGLNLLLFVSLEIRHLWQGALYIGLSTGNPEQYTYSAIWLLLAAIAMITAIKRGSSGLYRGAMALLVVVIVKIFLFDLAGLQGLLRVASFMGLGLVLLLLAWLHQRLLLAPNTAPDVSPATKDTGPS